MELGTLCLTLLFDIEIIKSCNKRMGLFVVFHMNVFAMLKSPAELFNYYALLRSHTITQTI